MSATREVKDLLGAATDLHRQGRLDEAEQLYGRLLDHDPRSFDALNRLAIVALQRGDFNEALSRIDRALRITPDAAAALSNRGSILIALRNYADALAAYDRVVELNSDDPDAHYNRGNVLLHLKRPVDALASYDSSLAIKPDFVEALNNRGNALLDLHRFEDALVSYHKALAIEPDYTEALNNCGAALLRLRRFEEALACYEQLLAVTPGSAEALNNQASALLKLKRPENALASCDKALAIKSDYVEALVNRGNALFDMHLSEEALASYEKALAFEPASVEALNNCANALFKLKRFEEALAKCDELLAVKPDVAEAFITRGHALSDLKRHALALESYDRALAIEPTSANALAARAHAATLCCNWTLSADIKGRLRASFDDTLFDGNCNCLGLLSMFDDPPLQQRVVERYCAHKTGAATKAAASTSVVRNRRLRIGYLSADLKVHPVAFLTTGLIETHDRSFCEVYGFSAAPDDGSPERKRLTAAFDHLIEVATLSDDALCREIRKAEIDILVDLGGHTRDSRILGLAKRPAPIQVSYLGYPGTIGAPFIDYIIADQFVIPKAAAQHYTEQVVYLPDCFQVNDDRRPIATRVPTRAQCGLPARGFIFCAFHNSYKLNPEVFDVWMRLLEAEPSSTIWMVAAAETHENLRREALRRGVDPARLVFAGPEKYADHLARQKLADLFLDAWPYNGGTTASDALWAGLPVLTLAGRSYAARMAGSLLQAVGLPELITYSPETYEALALRLAREPGLLDMVRQKLAANIRTAPLFDTTRFARHIEAAYARMWELHLRGEGPQSFCVEPIS